MVSDEEARAAAREILSQSRYARWDGDSDGWLRALEALVDWIPSWLIDALRWIQDVLIDTFLAEILEWFGRILNVFGVFGESPVPLGWLVICLLVASVTVIAYRIRQRLGLETSREEPLRQPSRRHSELIGEARECARAGRYLEAAHRVQLATLAMLIEFDLLELARSDPNRTLRRRVADSSLPEFERRKLVGLVDRLEALWFSEPREDQALFEEWVALDERLSRVAQRAER